MRVGVGYDVHPLTPGRRLVLGGMEIPFDKGLSGWSDADVLTHAVMDALLGAAALGDIGRHFPHGALRYRGISSLVLLREVKDKLEEQGWRVSNIDATIIAEQPMLSGYIGKMRRELSRALNITLSQVSVKASTSAELGFAGRGEGITACAIALIQGVSD